MPLTLVEYEVVVELNLSDIMTLNSLRSLLSNGSISLTLSPTVNVTTIDITTGKNGLCASLNNQSMDANFANQGDTK